MADLVARGVSARAGGRTSGSATVQNASVSLAPGELVVLLGPNGSGKTTLLRALVGVTVPMAGTCRVAGADVATLSPEVRARTLSYLPQMRPLAWPLAVRDVVALGRYAYGAGAGRLSHDDNAAVDAALGACDLMALAQRRTDELSGGERARMHVARALAAQAPILIADEPVAALDPRYQHQVMAVIADFVARGGAALVVVHDVALAAHYASRLIWMRDGQILADGTPEDTLTSQLMAEIYGVRAEVEGRTVKVLGPDLG